MDKTFTDLIPQDDTTIWIISILTIVFLTLLVNFTINRFLLKLIKRAEKSKTIWDDAVLKALRKPLRVIMWTIGFTIALEVTFDREADAEVFNLLYPAKNVIIIAALTWFGIRFMRFVETNMVDKITGDDKYKVDKTTVLAISKLGKLAIFLTGCLIAMQTLGFSISGILAAGGVSGLVIGLAAKDLLSNFFGAIMIYMDQPFKVGDWVRSPDQEIEGTVEDIGWRVTRIRTFDKRPLYVPNSVFTNISIENPSRMTNRRIKELVGVRYDDMSQVESITAGISKMLADHKDIDQGPTQFVHLVEFGASSVNILVYTFTKTTNWVEFQRIKQDVMLGIAHIIAEHKAEIAFPTQTLHIEGMDAVKP